MEMCPNNGNTNGNDEPVAKGTRVAVCQGTMGEHSLPGYGPVGFVKRPVRTRMPGVVGAGGEKPPATRLADSWLFLSFVSDIDSL